MNRTSKTLTIVKQFCTKAQPKKEVPKTFQQKLSQFLKSHKQTENIETFLPSKLLTSNRKTEIENLYLICPNIAETIVNRALPYIKNNDEQIICETNAGLGLITSKLLEQGFKLVRLYESDPEFRSSLKDFNEVYPNTVEIFTKDIFMLNRYAYMDKQDNANRVELLLKGVPRRNWSEKEVMTIFGPMPNLKFIRHLINSLVLENDIMSYGRIQIFCCIPTKIFKTLTATPEDNLLYYTNWSILFQLLFDIEHLDTFDRRFFLPWDKENKKKQDEYMYYVRIILKETLPVTPDQLLPFFFYFRQFYGRGNNRIIETVEKWIPDAGLNIIVPKKNYRKYFDNMNIFTRFKELTPQQLYYVFNEIINHPSYADSPFKNMIETNLIKYETVETDMVDEKLNIKTNIVIDPKSIDQT